MIKNSIVCFFDVKNRNEAISVLVKELKRAKKVKEGFKKAILKREKLSSTAIGSGIALPHAKWESLDDFVIAIGIQKGRGLEWEAIDNVPIKIIFMIGGSEKRQQEYLNLLSSITFLMKDKELRKNLIKCDTEKEVFDLIIKFFKK